MEGFDADPMSDDDDEAMGKSAARKGKLARQRRAHWDNFGPVTPKPSPKARQQHQRRTLLLHIQSCSSVSCETCATVVSTHNCQICTEPMGRDVTKIWMCQVCSKPQHLCCAKLWQKSQRARGSGYTCPMCRAPATPCPWRRAVQKRGVQLDGQVVQVLAHHIYPRARPGSLLDVYVRVAYADGYNSGREMVPAASLAPGRAADALRTYACSVKGARIQKYVFPQVRLRLAGVTEAE